MELIFGHTHGWTDRRDVGNSILDNVIFLFFYSLRLLAKAVLNLKDVCAKVTKAYRVTLAYQEFVDQMVCQVTWVQRDLLDPRVKRECLAISV